MSGFDKVKENAQGLAGKGEQQAEERGKQAVEGAKQGAERKPGDQSQPAPPQNAQQPAPPPGSDQPPPNQ